MPVFFAIEMKTLSSKIIIVSFVMEYYISLEVSELEQLLHVKEILKKSNTWTCLILFTYSFNMTVYCLWIHLVKV